MLNHNANVYFSWAPCYLKARIQNRGQEEGVEEDGHGSSSNFTKSKKHTFDPTYSKIGGFG